MVGGWCGGGGRVGETDMKTQNSSLFSLFSASSSRVVGCDFRCCSSLVVCCVVVCGGAAVVGCCCHVYLTIPYSKVASI